MEKNSEGFISAKDVDFSNESEVLKVALENEIKGRSLYKQYAEIVKSEMTKKVFVHLANEELKHIGDIQEFIKAESMKTDINVEEMTSSTKLEGAKEFFGQLISELKDQVHPSDDDNKSRDVGMKIEKAGYEYYKKAAETSKNDKLRKFFMWLMEQEQGHYMLIRNAFEYANNPESWLMGEEHWLLEG